MTSLMVLKLCYLAKNVMLCFSSMTSLMVLKLILENLMLD